MEMYHNDIYYNKDGSHKGYRVVGEQAKTVLKRVDIEGDFIHINKDAHNKELIILNKDETVVIYLVKEGKELFNLNKTKTPSNTLFLRISLLIKLWVGMSKLVEEVVG